MMWNGSAATERKRLWPVCRQLCLTGETGQLMGRCLSVTGALRGWPSPGEVGLMKGMGGCCWLGGMAVPSDLSGIWGPFCDCLRVMDLRQGVLFVKEPEPRVRRKEKQSCQPWSVPVQPGSCSQFSAQVVNPSLSVRKERGSPSCVLLIRLVGI